jgi:hypothetical protein
MKKKKKSTVNKSGNYTKPGMRKRLFNQIKAANVQGTAAGKWSARKAQLLAKRYKAAGGGYKVGIGEHPQHIEEMDKIIHKIGEAKDKLSIIKNI